MELPGADHLPWIGDTDGLLDEVEVFLTGVRRGPDPDRRLATVLFTDIAGSTATAAAPGDRHWHQLLEEHHRRVRRELDRFGGGRSTRPGTASSRPSTARHGPSGARAPSAQRCGLGLDVRAGVHTGEVEVLGGEVRCFAVHIGACVADEAGPGEVLVSSTVKDLVAGSGLWIRERGRTELRGVPGNWQLYVGQDGA